MTANNEEFVSDIAVDNSKCEAVMNRENFERNLTNMWGYSNVGIEAKRAAMSMLATKTGMYARIPSESCSLLPYNLAPYGEPCPMETAQIEIRYAGYEQDFNLDTASFTDKNLVAELINHDIMLERCKALLNKDGVIAVNYILLKDKYNFSKISFYDTGIDYMIGIEFTDSLNNKEKIETELYYKKNH